MDSAWLENLLLGPRQFLQSKPIQRPLLIPTNEMAVESLFKSSMNHVDHLHTKTFLTFQCALHVILIPNTDLISLFTSYVLSLEFKCSLNVYFIFLCDYIL